jgi:hypothetical protein
MNIELVLFLTDQEDLMFNFFFDKGPSRIYPRVKFPYKFWKESRENHPNIKGYKVLGISK